MTDKIRTSAYLTDEIELYLRTVAAMNRTSMSKYIEWLIIKDMLETKDITKKFKAGYMDKEVYREETREKSFDDYPD